MSFFSYKCHKCQKITNIKHGKDDKPKVKCEKCGSETKKLISQNVGIGFVGNGFYVNDKNK